jgi:hypothetical protein
VSPVGFFSKIAGLVNVLPGVALEFLRGLVNFMFALSAGETKS